MEKGSSLPLLQNWTYDRTVHNVCIFVNWYDCNTITGNIYISVPYGSVTVKLSRFRALSLENDRNFSLLPRVTLVLYDERQSYA